MLGEMRQRETRVLDVSTMHNAPTSIDEPLLPFSQSVKPESAPHASLVDAQLPLAHNGARPRPARAHLPWPSAKLVAAAFLLLSAISRLAMCPSTSTSLLSAPLLH
jgi:hypothetical protein